MRDEKGRFMKGNIPWHKGTHGLIKSSPNTFKKGHTSWLKDTHIQTNTGRTHFKKGKSPSQHKIGCHCFRCTRIPPFKGLTKETDERLKKISENLKGKKLTSEHRKKLSLSHIGKPSPLKGKSLIHSGSFKRGHEVPQKWRDKVGTIMKNFYSNPLEREKVRIRRLHQVFPFKDTDIEIILQEQLKNNNISFETHKPIFGQPDITIGKICIFADGCYWHGCEICYDKNKFTSKQRKTIIRDILVTQKLINDGYVVLRFWEHEINENPEKVIEKIRKFMEDENEKTITVSGNSVGHLSTKSISNCSRPTQSKDVESHILIDDQVCSDVRSQNIPDLVIACKYRNYADFGNLGTDNSLVSYHSIGKSSFPATSVRTSCNSQVGHMEQLTKFITNW